MSLPSLFPSPFLRAFAVAGFGTRHHPNFGALCVRSLTHTVLRGGGSTSSSRPSFRVTAAQRTTVWRSSAPFCRVAHAMSLASSSPGGDRYAGDNGGAASDAATMTAAVVAAAAAAAALPPPPPPSWVWKPRSKLVDEDGRARHAPSLMPLRRFGATQWHRRFLFVDQHLLCYGKERGRRDKQVPFELIESVQRETAEAGLREHAPAEFAGFVWRLAIRGRVLLLCAESEDSVQAWVGYLAALLRVMRSAAAPQPAATHRLATVPSSPSSSPPIPSSTTLASATAEPGTRSRDAPLASEQSPRTVSPEGAEDAVDGAGGGGSDAEDALDASSDDSEGEDSGNDGDAAATPTHDSAALGAAPGAPHAPPDAEQAGRPLPRELRLARVLLSLAATPHSHIGYRLPALAPYFRSGDDVSSVVFSRAMEKVGKRDNAQPREVVLTTRHLYLFSKARIGSGLQLRCIDMRDITGVMESATDATLLAVLVPTFHDVLLKVVPQNSCVPGSPAEVKRQLVAHLYRSHCDIQTDHRFLFRESANVAQAIRRTEDARHPAIAVCGGDQMRAGEHAALLPIFARHADEAVYWSSMVRQVLADRQPQLRALVVTEGSVYSLADTLQKVVRRTCLSDLLALEYDKDAQTVLLQCRAVDVLFNVQSSVEFDDLLRVLPAAVAAGFERALRTTASKQLYSHAKLDALATVREAGRAAADGRDGGSRTLSPASRRRRAGLHWPRLHVGGGGVGGGRGGGGGGGGAARLLQAISAMDDGDDDGVEGAGAGGPYRHGLQGDYRDTQAIRRFCAQFRFVEEVLQDYDDVVELLRQHAVGAAGSDWDALRLRHTPLPTSAPTGPICFSAACRLLEGKECAMLAKPAAHELDDAVVLGMGTRRAVCVTAAGFVFLRHGVAAVAAARVSPTSPSLPPRRSGPVVRGQAARGPDAETGERVLAEVPWSAVAAVVRCHRREGSSVAILTNRTHPADFLVHLDSPATMLRLVAAAAGCYAASRPRSPHEAALLPPVYAAPRAQNLAAALKKTLYDPFPTVALRYTPATFASDRLRMAFVPDVADALRRFGDNTVYFSGVAWRVRSATLRRCGGQLESDPGADMRRHNNHLYKSLILVVTNVAVYHCTKGGFEVVRRTLLTDITGITTGLDDPDTVLLTVPAEYDMYVRVGGRGAELVARVQEAYLEWTSYGHYRPYEAQSSHTVAAYGLPVHRVAFVAAHAALTKPAHFNDLQASRSAADCLHRTRRWHLQALRRAIAAVARAQAVAARRERRPGAAAVTWSRVQALLAERQSLLYFIQRRCFRFGLTSEVCEEMQHAQQLLDAHAAMEAAAAALLQATRTGDAEAVEAALRKAGAVPELRLLVEEEARRYERYCARHDCVVSILAVVERYRYRPVHCVSLQTLEAALLDLVAEARGLGFSAEFLRHAVRVVRVLTQRTQLQRAVRAMPNWSTATAPGGGSGALLLQQAAWEVGMTWTPPPLPQSARTDDGGRLVTRREMHLAHTALARATASGDATLVRGSLTLACLVLQVGAREGYGAAAHSDDDAAAVTELRRLLDETQASCVDRVEEREHLRRQLHAFVATRQQRQRQRAWTPERLAAMLSQCAQLEAAVAAGPADVQADAAAVLALERRLLTTEAHRLGRLRALQRRDGAAARRYERALARRASAVAQAATRQHRRETAQQARRLAKSLASWRAQVAEMTAAAEAVLTAPDAETDESLRLCIKRCVHLERWIADAAARYGLQGSASHRPGLDKASTDATPHAERAVRALAELLSTLQAAATRVERVLTQRTRPPRRGVGAAADAAARLPEDGAGAAAAAETSTPATLPAEAERLLAAQDIAGLVAFVQAHEGSSGRADPATSAMLEALQLQWREVRCQRRWVAALHHRLHAAAVLRSRALLERELERAAAVSFSDAAVVTAGRLLAVMASEKTPMESSNAAREASTSSTSHPTNTAVVTLPSDDAVLAAPPTPPPPPHPAMAEMHRATAALTQAADAAAASGPPPDTPALLRQLSRAITAFVEGAAAARAPPTVDSTPLRVDGATAHVGAYVAAWRAVLVHHVRPAGLVLKTPRTAWDLVRAVGEARTDDGVVAAPYVHRVSSDFQRLYRGGGDGAAAQLRTDTVLLVLLCTSHRLTCVLDGLVQLRDAGRRALLLPESALAQPGPVRALLAAAAVCDTLDWGTTSVQALAVECLFPSDAPAAPSPPPPPVSHVASASSAASPPPPPTLPPAEAEAHESAAARRTEACARAAEGLQRAVRSVADFFTAHVGAFGASGDAAALFDERRCPAVGDLVDRSVLPPVLALLTCGLVRRYELVRTRTLWTVLVELRGYLASSSRTLVGAEVHSIMELVEALTDAAAERSRRVARLRDLPEEALDDVRVRMFLRECVNRRQLYPLVTTLFPAPAGSEGWCGSESSTLWTLYDPAQCVLYPPQDPATAPLHALLRRLSALPFALVVDRELR